MQPMDKKLVMIVLNILILFTVLLSAEEYWRDYIHRSDPDNFDMPPLMTGELDREDALRSGSYTVVERNSAGNILEAVTMLRNEPNYYFVYYYDEDGRLLLHEMKAFLQNDEILISRVIYTYDGTGSLQSSACYSTNIISRQKKLKYLKEYTGSNYRLFDYTPAEPDPQRERKLDEVKRNLEELIRLESRGAIKKLLGIR